MTFALLIADVPGRHVVVAVSSVALIGVGYYISRASRRLA